MASKLASIGLGLSFVGAGVLIMLFGGRLTAALNSMYARLPGQLKYPTWAHRAFGGFIVGFGLVIGSVGGTLAH